MTDQQLFITLSVAYLELGQKMWKKSRLRYEHSPIMLSGALLQLLPAVSRFRVSSAPLFVVRLSFIGPRTYFAELKVILLEISLIAIEY